MGNDIENINDLLQKILIGLTTVSGIFALLRNFFEQLKPCINVIAFLGTQIIPNGLIVWYLLYLSAINTHRITKPNILLLLVLQATAAIVIYNLIWGIWLYPKIKKLLPKKKSKKSSLISTITKK
jgi:hypothetical protein